MVSGARLVGVTASMGRSPITVCVVGILVACVLSQLSHGQLGIAATFGFDMLRIIIYYLLVITLVDTPERMRSFIRWIVLFTVVLTGLALLHYHGMIQIESLDAVRQKDIDPETGEVRVIPRLCSTGVFNDPNDLSTILVLASIASLFLFENTPRGLGRFLWLTPLGIFLYALKLTFSRGGLINLAVSLLILCRAKYGWKKTIGISALGLPAVIVLFAGRQTSVDVGSTTDTSQQRIQVWAEGLNLFREAPLFGIGIGNYADRVELVAHNSYVHTYAELGFFGGTLFVGAFYTGLWGVWRLGKEGVIIYDRLTMQMRPYIWAMICSYSVGMLSLSRPYTVTTYLVFGVAGAYLRIADLRASIAGLRFDSQFVQRLLFVGVAWVVILYMFIRLTVRWK